ncbi:MAG: DUF4412 domain-containing protein [Thermoanaerobaculia bacterium]
MRRTTLLFSVMLFLLSLPLSAAVQEAVHYEFRQVLQTGTDGAGPLETEGKAIVDGMNSRVEYTRSPYYPPGTFVISTNGSRNMFVVNPANKTYAEINVGNAATALGTARIKVSNLKTSVQELDDHQVIAGYPTDHYRFESSYDMTVTLGSLPVTQSIHTTIDKWTTNLFPSADVGLSSNPPPTGNPELDQLLSTEATKIKGFPLKQVMVIATQAQNTGSGGAKEISSSRRQTAELVVTSIRTAPAAPSSFQIPPGYARMEPGQTEPESNVHMLEMQPAVPAPPQ